MKEKNQGIVAIFPGSFDPFTNGHLDISHRALKLFSKLIIAILDNPYKKPLFSVDERKYLIGQSLAGCKGELVVDSFSGLLVDYAKDKSDCVIVRGLRAVSDYEYEAQMALMNRNISGGLETIFLLTSEENSYISSSVVKQVAQFGGNVSSMVPMPVHEALNKKFIAA
ncbi:MAG: pantetheine-phosphate adenylyltransferase [Bdellovibrionales bacterium]|nr:pantetheine-phosphate adenylyltransferase [Bdellovibrionales bacterium]